MGSGSDLNALAYMDSLTDKYDEGISLAEKALTIHQNIQNKNGISIPLALLLDATGGKMNMQRHQSMLTVLSLLQPKLTTNSESRKT